MPIFRFESTVDAPLGQVFAWHTRPGAMERLTPPWEALEVTERTGGMEDGGTVTLRFRRGPIPISWTVRHTAFEKDVMFRDEQISGPFQRWVHTHRFEAVGEDRCRVLDEVDWEAPLGGLGEFFGRGFIEDDLRALFHFRHARLAGDLARHRDGGLVGEWRVGITGASGLLGQHMTHLLTTGGHTVVPFVRSGRPHSSGAIQWDPAAGTIETENLERLDAVIHLAGESIAGDRWTPEKKKRIRDSRVGGTRLLAEALAGLRNRPGTLISASAIGYYGNRGDVVVREDAGPGRGFLAEVCQDWEAATAPAERAGIRTVHLRTGIVLTPGGGALAEMLTPFKAGAGGRIGTGRQYMSWIDLDDLGGLILYAMGHGAIRGALNATAPLPVTNATFATTLGRVLGRPSIVPLPSLAVRALFGEMGRSLLLDGARVLPAKATEAGFEFRFQGLEESLRHQLGRDET